MFKKMELLEHSDHPEKIIRYRVKWGKGITYVQSFYFFSFLATFLIFRLIIENIVLISKFHFGVFKHC